MSVWRNFRRVDTVSRSYPFLNCVKGLSWSDSSMATSGDFRVWRAPVEHIAHVCRGPWTGARCAGIRDTLQALCGTAAFASGRARKHDPARIRARLHPGHSSSSCYCNSSSRITTSCIITIVWPSTPEDVQGGGAGGLYKMSMYIAIYIYIYIYMHMCVYIYIYRERERSAWSLLLVASILWSSLLSAFVLWIPVYIYTYIYIYRERDTYTCIDIIIIIITIIIIIIINCIIMIIRPGWCWRCRTCRGGPPPCACGQ